MKYACPKIENGLSLEKLGFILGINHTRLKALHKYNMFFLKKELIQINKIQQRKKKLTWIILLLNTNESTSFS